MYTLAHARHSVSQCVNVCMYMYMYVLTVLFSNLLLCTYFTCRPRTLDKWRVKMK